MRKKLIQLLFIIITIIILIACNDRKYTTGQIGPTRGIIFNTNVNTIEAQVYKSSTCYDFDVAEKTVSDLSIKENWNEIKDDFKLPTLEEVQFIMQNNYSNALWNDSTRPCSDYFWLENGVAYNFITKKTGVGIERANLLIIRDLKEKSK